MKRKVVMALLLLCGVLPVMSAAAEELDPMEGIVYEEVDISQWLAPNGSEIGENAHIAYVPEVSDGKAAYKLLCTVDKNNEVHIAGWTANYDADAQNWELVIPSEVDGKKVMSIAAGAFHNCREFVGKVKIPEGLTVIESNTFYGCSGLTGVDFSEAANLQIISDGAFFECKNLEGNLVFPESVKKIGASAFSGCEKLTGTLDLSGVEEIHRYAFYNCRGFDGELKLPAALTKIEESTFNGCENLKGDLCLDNITGLKEVGACAFEKCRSLDGILRLPSGIEAVGAGAFKECTNLKSCAADTKPEDQVFDLKDTQLTRIDKEVFCGCESLTGKLVLPANVTEVNTGAFMNCRGFTGIDFSPAAGLTAIGDSAFENCTGLADNLDLSVTAVEIIGAGAFKSVGRDGETGGLKLPTSLKTIGNSAFEGSRFGSGKDAEKALNFTGLTQLTAIGDNAFKDCRYLEGSLNLSAASALESIGAGAFVGCDGLTGVLNLPASLKIIGNSAFEGSRFGSGEGASGRLYFNDLTSLETIGDCAFKNCKSLRSDLAMTNLSSLKSIGREAFTGCENLSNLNMQGLTALEKIGDSAFEGCENLNGSVNLTSSVKLAEIGNNAFKDCKRLDALNLSGLEALVKLGDGAFQGCENMISRDMNLSASRKLEAIGANAFKDCKGITGTLYIHQLTEQDVKDEIEGLKAINAGAFENCGLTGSLDLSGAANLTVIGERAFYVSESDKGQFTGTLKMPDSLEIIGAYAFYENGFVDEKKDGKVVPLKLPVNLKTIGEYAFKSREAQRENGISQLDVSAAVNLETIGKSAFLHCVFKGTLDLSGASHLGTIGDSAFNGCDELVKAVLPGSLGNTGSGLGEGVFYGCVRLEEIELQEGMAEVNISNVENYGLLKIHDRGVKSVKSLPKYAVVDGSADSRAVIWAREHGILVEENRTQETVSVNSVDGLLEAVKDGSYKVIELADGRYILPSSLEIRSQIKMTLKAANPGMVEILVEDTSVPVVMIEAAQNVSIDGCILGYAEKIVNDPIAYRTAEVNKSIIYVVLSNHVSVEGCELWGAEFAGVSYKSVHGLTINKSIIRDCRRYAVYNQLAEYQQESDYNGIDVKFMNCIINGNGKGYYLNGSRQSYPVSCAGNVSFEGCILLNNHGEYFSERSSARRIECREYNNKYDRKTPKVSGVCLNGITWYVTDDVVSVGYPLVMGNGDIYNNGDIPNGKKEGRVLPYSEYSLPWTYWAELNEKKEVRICDSEGVSYPDYSDYPVFTAAPDNTVEKIGDLTLEKDGRYYFYQNGVKVRSQEAYVNDAWRWFDEDGSMAVSKDVYLRSSGGKWVRYNADGEMIKGQDGEYYFEEITGAMVKGPWILEDGRKVFYDIQTGRMVRNRQYIVYDKPINVDGTIVGGSQEQENVTGTRYFFAEDGSYRSGPDTLFWVWIDGRAYWYEDWQRQGWKPEDPSYRGKEIYDPKSKYWYWLDNVQQGAKAVSKDVYQESWSAYPDREDGRTGKWVRYDEEGRMVKGWHDVPAGRYYFENITGAMAKGRVKINIKVEIDGEEQEQEQIFEFDQVTGILKQ